MVTAAVVQMDVLIGRNPENQARILDLAARTQADLVVFPECANSGYAFESAQEAMPYAETIPGPFVDQLLAVARRERRFLAVGMLEKCGDTLHNSAVLVTPEGDVHLYRKTHLPFIGLDRFVTPGESLGLFDTSLGKLGLAICYEWRFPEVPRSLALQGADLLLGLSNWPGGALVIPTMLVPARAVENRVWIVSSNRVGLERGHQFIGRSAIVAPDGREAAAMDESADGVAVASLDLALAANKHLAKIPGAYEIDLWQDRRPALYGAVTGENAHA